VKTQAQKFAAYLDQHEDFAAAARAVFDGAADEIADKPKIWQMLAGLKLLQHQSFTSSGDAKTIEKFILKVCKDLSKSDHRAVSASLSTHYHRQKRYEEAINALDTALDGERDSVRRALLLRNLAKVHLTAGHVAEALKTCSRFRDKGCDTHQAGNAIRLLKSRILLNLAADQQVREMIDSINSRDLVVWPLPLEFRYILGMLKILDHWQDKKSLPGHYQTIIKDIPDDRAASRVFYELEYELFKLLTAPRSIKNKQAFQSRCRHLGRTGNCMWLANITIRCHGTLSGAEGEKDHRSHLKSEWLQFSRSDNEASFQLAGLLLCEQLIKVGVPSVAGFVLETVQDQVQKLRGQLTPALSRSIEKHPSFVLEQVDALNRQLPSSYRLHQDDWLLSG
jgi:tetratricopeptide (TPR) repeat protein